MVIKPWPHILYMVCSYIMAEAVQVFQTKGCYTGHAGGCTDERGVLRVL